jgi:Tol biopolymer transport system component
MTSTRRFEQDLPALLDDLYVAGTPDYRDDLVRRTAAIRQRPAWTFPERWLPMDLATRRLPFAAVPLRALIVLALILILAAAAVLLTVGSRHPLPAPFGPAGNGLIASSHNGNIVAWDPATASSRSIVDGPEVDSDAGYSPDGTQLAFIRTIGAEAFLMVSNIDGTNVRRVHALPLGRNAWENWAADSRHLGVIDLIDGRIRFVLVPTDGSAERVADMGSLTPLDFSFRPPDGREMVVRALDGGVPDLYLMNPDGTNIRKLGRPNNGADLELAGAGWSPDGTRLTFTVTGTSGLLRVHMLTLATMQEVELPAPLDAGVHQAWAAWSPAGSQILVQRFTEHVAWLGLLPADGMSTGRDIGTPRSSADGSSMDDGWSPDGRSILVRYDPEHILSIDAASGRETQLNWSVDKIPDWQRLAL